MNTRAKYTFAILGNERHRGTLFAYETESGLVFSHSLLNHGSPLFSTSEAAVHDFWDTKLRLPKHVHRVIFGE